jgi:hypothetical protein
MTKTDNTNIPANTPAMSKWHGCYTVVGKSADRANQAFFRPAASMY